MIFLNAIFIVIIHATATITGANARIGVENQISKHRKLRSNEKNGIPYQYIVVFSNQYANNNPKTSLLSKIISLFKDQTDDQQPQTALSQLTKSLHTKITFHGINKNDNQRRNTENENENPTTDNEDSNNVLDILHIYDDNAFRGFAVSNLRSKLLLQRILNDKDVAYVEQDSIIQAIVTADGADMDADDNSATVPWGLDRVFQRNLPLDSKNFTSGYYTGAGVHVYILDSGVRATHDEFDGRVTCSMDIITGTEGDGCAEGSGHGTHVAGIIGGRTYGVAKESQLFSVRILDDNGNGKMSGVLDAVNYVIKQKQSNPEVPIILNLSLGGSGGESEALNEVINNGSSQYNVHTIVSAGNDFKWACLQSPANADEAITVGATTETDAMASFSNWGSCVDFLAPGTNIQSAWKGSDNNTMYRSGTSMAAPFVAGVAALHLQMNPSLSTKELRQLLIENAVQNIVEIPFWAIEQPNYLINYNPIQR